MRQNLRVLFLKGRTLLAVLTTVLVLASAFSVTFGVREAIRNKYSVYVVIDPGHGGGDGGAVSKNGLKESDVTLTIGKRLKKMFTSYGIGVVMTRDEDVSLGKTKRSDMLARKEIIEKTRPAAVISIHANAFAGRSRRGAQVFFSGEEGKMLAGFIQNNLNRKVNSVYNGNEYSALTGDYYIVKCTNYPSCIVECGFISNPSDEKLLQDEKYIDDLSFAVFSATAAFLYCTQNDCVSSIEQI